MGSLNVGSSFAFFSLDVLACPLDHSSLEPAGKDLVCQQGHKFEVEQGYPVFAKSPRREIVPGNMGPKPPVNDDHAAVDSFVDDWIVNTNGNLYWSARGRLKRYPIPEWPFSRGAGKRLLDVGCSWGRWSASAARAGYKPIGLDVHLDAVAAAGRVSNQLGLQAEFVCADADAFPIRTNSMDMVFSYSVLQHLERSKVLRFFAECFRILKPGGLCLVQMPNRFGLVSILQQARRGFREARADTFEMRYWSHSEIQNGLASAGMMAPRIFTDGFFSQNARTSDLDLLSAAGNCIVLASELGRRASVLIPPLTRFADSLWVQSQKES